MRRDMVTIERVVYPRMQSIDPMKDAQSDSRRLTDGLVSRAELIRERGGDPVKVLDELVAEGVTLGGDPLNEQRQIAWNTSSAAEVIRKRGGNVEQIFAERKREIELFGGEDEGGGE